MFVLVDANNRLVSTHATLADARDSRTAGTWIKSAADWRRANA